MKLTKYLNSRHFNLIEQWLTERNTFVPSPDDMPYVGFVAFKGEEPVGAAFLRIVEGGFGMLDGLVTNPKSSSHSRNWAIEILTHQIIKEAEDLKLKSLIAYTADESILMRSKSHGFVVTPHRLMVISNLDKKSIC